MAPSRGKLWRACSKAWSEIPAKEVRPGDRVAETGAQLGIEAMLRELAGGDGGPRADNSRVTECFKSVDKDRSGSIGYPQFMALAELYADKSALAGVAVVGDASSTPANGRPRGMTDQRKRKFKSNLQEECWNAFQWVDPEGVGALNVTQSKTALQMIFQRAGAPNPPDEWYNAAFQNFDENGDGLIEFADMYEIGKQHCAATLGPDHKVFQLPAGQTISRAGSGFDEPQSPKKQPPQQPQQQPQRQQQQPPPPQQQSPNGGGYPVAPVSPPVAGPPVLSEAAASAMRAAAASQELGRSQCRDLVNVGLAKVPGSAAPPPEWLNQAFARYEDDDGLLSPDDVVKVLGEWLQSQQSSGEPRPALNKKKTVKMAFAEPETREFSEDSEDGESKSRSGSEVWTPNSQGSEASSRMSLSQSNRLRTTTAGSMRSRKSVVPIAAQVLTPKYDGQLKLFDDYDFKDHKGTGAFGSVREVLHKRTALKRACKSVTIRSPKHFELVETEVNLMRRLDHPNVLRLFESYYDGDRNIYLIIELCDGGAFGERIEEMKPKLMPPQQVAWAARDMLAALKYCHQQGIIHRDIKPDNLLYLRKVEDSPLKIIDLGLSDFLTRIERQGGGPRKSEAAHKIGTPHYMAPEIYTDGVYDDKVDVFACGICLVEALTGAHPFFELGVDNLETIREKIVRRGVDYGTPAWQRVPPDARQVCQMLLDPDRNRRADTTMALEHPWLRDSRTPSGGKGKIKPSVFDALARFGTHNVLKQAAFRVLAVQLSDSQVAPHERQFQFLDLDGSGRISSEELLQGARRSSVKLDPVQVQDTISVFSRQAGGGQQPSFGEAGPEVGFTDFLAALVERDVKPTEAQMKDVFERFCAKDTPAITFDSLRGALYATAAPSKDDVPQSMSGEDVSEDELRQVFADLGRGGRIDFHAFCDMWQCEEDDDLE